MPSPWWTKRAHERQLALGPLNLDAQLYAVPGTNFGTVELVVLYAVEQSITKAVR